MTLAIPAAAGEMDYGAMIGVTQGATFVVALPNTPQAPLWLQDVQPL